MTISTKKSSTKKSSATSKSTKKQESPQSIERSVGRHGDEVVGRSTVGAPTDRQDKKSALIDLAQESGSVRKKVDELLLLASESRREKSGEVEVAPFIKPSQRLQRRSRDQAWADKGFIAVSPGKSKLRHRILPRSVIGISFMLLASAVGVAFSGAAFYAYYDNRLAENEREVSRFVDGFDQQFSDATGAIDDLRVGAVEDIRTELQPIEGVISDADGVVNLPTTAGESVWALETRDEQGRAVLGSAFAVLKHERGTALITSYSLVVASTTAPSPELTLTKRGEKINGQLWSWDAENDLAVVMVSQDLPVVALATVEEQSASVGTRVFAVSGFGGQAATASPGVLLDQSTTGMQHTAAVGTMFQGGPLVNGAGKVVGLSTLNYRPTGVDPGMVLAAPNAASFCDQILNCSETTETVELDVAVTEAEAPPAGNEPEAPPAENEPETPAETSSEAPTETSVEDGE